MVIAGFPWKLLSTAGIQ